MCFACSLELSRVTASLYLTNPIHTNTHIRTADTSIITPPLHEFGVEEDFRVANSTDMRALRCLEWESSERGNTFPLQASISLGHVEDSTGL